MTNSAKKLAAILVSIVLATAACSDAANVTAPRMQPGPASFDGIGWIGSGNRTDTTTTNPTATTTTTDTTTQQGSEESTGGIGWTGRGN